MLTLELISAEQWEKILQANSIALEKDARAAKQHCFVCNWPLDPANVHIYPDGTRSGHVCATCADMAEAIAVRPGLQEAHTEWRMEQARKLAILRGNIQ